MELIRHSKPSIGEEECAAVARVLASGQLAQGEEVAAFERECAAFCRYRYGVAVNSGTSALHLALGALEVGAGDTVAVPAYACAALITATALAGAQPVLCDVGPDYNLLPEQAPADCRVAIVPHLFGAPARFPAAAAVIDDIAQSMGGTMGTAAPAAVTSFYATKLMTTGEGGMLLTNQEAIAAYARDRRDYDNRDDFVQRFPYKMTEFQAAIGRVQLRSLPEFIARRRAIAVRYQEAFARLPLRLPNPDGHVFFRYVVGTPDRAALQTHLERHGIEAKRPVHRPAHHFLGGTFPGAETAHRECLSLPIYPALLESEREHVIDSVCVFFGTES